MTSLLARFRIGTLCKVKTSIVCWRLTSCVGGIDEGPDCDCIGWRAGFGLEVARLLSEQGARVASWDIDSGNAAAMSGLSEGALAIECDITDLASVEAAYARTGDLLRTPLFMVNSAGIAGLNAPLESYGVED